MLAISEFLEQRHSLPVIDVRSEGEFARGHVPGAINIPILNNEERQVVGTTYKTQGAAQAVKEAVRLVGPRLSSILEQAEHVAQQQALVYCWRGGMRSNNFCWLLERIGIKATPLHGGYKAYRTNALQSFALPLTFRVLSGSTGSGKTEILQALKRQGEQVLCLETLANHKGSAFGGLGLGEQPTTEQFENNLFEEILRLDTSKKIWIEDESIAIGKIFIPEPLWKNLRRSALVKLEVPKEIRVQRLVQEYGRVATEQLAEAMQRIVTKLGGQHFNAGKEKLLAGDLAATADILLTYYDKAYANAIASRQNQVEREVTFDWKNLLALVSELTT
jgi:tRNA 2-selenouridine synthase